MPPLIFIAEKTFTIDKKVNIPSLGIVLNVLVHNHYLAFFFFPVYMVWNKGKRQVMKQSNTIFSFFASLSIKML